MSDPVIPAIAAGKPSGDGPPPVKLGDVFKPIERTSTADEWNKARDLLGEQVRIMLDLEDEHAVVEGRLLSVCEDGSFVVLDDMGMKHYCWPLLKVVKS
jgi:hypothetical protein